MLSNNVNRKFISSLDISDYEILTEDGYKDVSQIHKTIEYEKWVIELENGFKLDCADTHILIDENYNEVFARDSLGVMLRTQSGLSKVVSVINTNDMEHMYDITVESEDHTYYTNSILSHNTSSVVGFLLHYILFNEDKTVGVLAHKIAGAREVLDRLQLAYEHIPKYLQQGIKEWNKGNISLENNSKILTSASNGAGVRGKSLSVLFVDETAFVPNNQWEDFWTGTYPVISSGTETKVILVSTPNGLNHFYKLWVDAKENTSSFNPIEVNWWDVPGRDEKWKEDMIGDIGQHRFNQEFGNSFLGSSNTLISLDTLQRLVYKQPIQEKDGLRIFKQPEDGQLYFMTVDVGYGRGQDASTFSIFNITQFPYEQVATYRSNDISPMLFPNIIYNTAINYNNAFVLVENNDIGKTVLGVLNYELEYEELITLNENGKQNPDIGCRMTKQVKSVGCSNLKDIIEADKLILVDDNTIQEISTFIGKGNSYAADQGKHDDSVMNLVLFAYTLKTNTFEDLTDQNFRQNMYENRIKEMEEDMMGFFSSDLEGEEDDVAWLQ